MAGPLRGHLDVLRKRETAVSRVAWLGLPGRHFGFVAGRRANLRLFAVARSASLQAGGLDAGVGDASGHHAAWSRAVGMPTGP